MKELSVQDLHNLAMNIVGEDLKSKGFEFLSINSQLKKNPQFVALKHKKIHFIVVRAVEFPEDPRDYDTILLETIKRHALKFKAKVFYAGVGLANSKDYKAPLYKDEPYVVNYTGIQEV